MIESRNSRFVVGLILVCTCGLALCSEPRQTRTGLRFVVNDKESLRWFNDRMQSGRGPVEPTHVAVFHVRRSGLHIQRDYKGVLQMAQTSAGKSLPKLQQQFLSASDSFVMRSAENMRNHETAMLYAVSAEDARKMVQAFLEVAISGAEAGLQDAKTKLQSYEERAAEFSKEIPNKEAELEAVTVAHEKAKIETHNPASDADAAEESKGIILEMNALLDSLAIEITGIEAKIAAVEKIKSEKPASSAEGLARLEDIVNEQTVELAGALAKKKAAIAIREREEKFHNLYRKRAALAKQVTGLKKNLSQVESGRREMAKTLAEQESYMLWPQVYQNEVTIYRVGRK